MSFIFDDLLRTMFGGEKLQKLAAPVITCENDVVTMTGAGTIFYTADGTTPTTLSSIYTSPIAINQDTTFKAFCYAPGMADSDVTTYLAVASGYSAMPLYLENNTSSNGTVTFKKQRSEAPSIEVFTSTDRINWTSAGTTSANGITATLPANGRLYIRATANQWSNTSYWNMIDCNVNHTVNGNILSLLYGSSFANYSTLPNYNQTLMYLFKGNTNVTSAANLIFPSNTRINCYMGMFEDCTALTTPPVLPATSLSNLCYTAMFMGCTSLTTAPSLPAHTMKEYCYQSMFSGCTSLTTAPTLSATLLDTLCFSRMFEDCTSLTNVPSNYLPLTDLADGCYEYMFYGCTELRTAPNLPARIVTSYGYQYMFTGCRKLNYVKALFTNNPMAMDSTKAWMLNVRATGTFVKSAKAQWSIVGENGVPSGWTIETV